MFGKASLLRLRESLVVRAQFSRNVLNKNKNTWKVVLTNINIRAAQRIMHQHMIEVTILLLLSYFWMNRCDPGFSSMLNWSVCGASLDVIDQAIQLQGCTRVQQMQLRGVSVQMITQSDTTTQISIMTESINIEQLFVRSVVLLHWVLSPKR